MTHCSSCAAISDGERAGPKPCAANFCSSISLLVPIWHERDEPDDRVAKWNRPPFRFLCCRVTTRWCRFPCCSGWFLCQFGSESLPGPYQDNTVVKCGSVWRWKGWRKMNGVPCSARQFLLQYIKCVFFTAYGFFPLLLQGWAFVFWGWCLCQGVVGPMNLSTLCLSLIFSLLWFLSPPPSLFCLSFIFLSAKSRLSPPPLLALDHCFFTTSLSSSPLFFF